MEAAEEGGRTGDERFKSDAKDDELGPMIEEGTSAITMS